MTADSSATGAPPHVVEDCRGILRVLSDGTILRSPAPLGGTDVHTDPSVEWRDVVYDEPRGLRLRAYKPAVAAGTGRLPVVVYYHGGGFCIGSYAWPIFHASCSRLAAGLPAVVLSADYRLAPEHRLPAAFDDAAAVLLWLRDQAAGTMTTDPWLAEFADFGKTFVAGESAGGVMSHHMAVRFSAPGSLGSVRIRGFVLLMPFFLGVEPIRSELFLLPDAFLNRDMCARYARLALPAGATKDHQFVNPFGSDSPSLDPVDVGPMLVVAAEHDILRDRNVEYAARMRDTGKPVALVEFPGEGHAFFSLRPWSEPVDELIRVMKRFMEKACQTSVV